MDNLPAFFSGMAVGFLLAAAAWASHISRHYTSKSSAQPPHDIGLRDPGVAFHSPPPGRTASVDVNLTVAADQVAEFAQALEDNREAIIAAIEETLRPKPANDAFPFGLKIVADPSVPDGEIWVRSVDRLA